MFYEIEFKGQIREGQIRDTETGRGGQDLCMQEEAAIPLTGVHPERQALLLLRSLHPVLNPGAGGIPTQYPIRNPVHRVVQRC